MMKIATRFRKKYRVHPWFFCLCQIWPSISDGGKLNRAIPELRSVPYFQVAGKFCEWARKRNFEIQGKHRSVLPVRTFKKPKCRLNGNLCDLLIVRDIQMSVTTRRASKLNDIFSLVQLRVFVLICNPCFRLKYDLWITNSRLKIQIFLFHILLMNMSDYLLSLEEQCSIVWSFHDW